jgi:hypothetical protein
MRRLFAIVSLAAGALFILASVAILGVWFRQGRAVALYGITYLFLAGILILPLLVLAWVLILWRKRGLRLDRLAFASTVGGLALLLGVTGALVFADSYVRFDVYNEGRRPLREVSISGRGAAGRIDVVPPGGRRTVAVRCRGILAPSMGEVRIRFRDGAQIQTLVVYSAEREMTDDVVQIRFDGSRVRRSPGGLLFPP